MSNNPIEMEAINQQMKEDIQALIDKGGLPTALLESGHSRVPPRPFLNMPRRQGKSVFGGLAEMVEKLNRKEAAKIVPVKIGKTLTGIKSPIDYELESKRRQNFIDPNLGIIDDPIKEQSFKSTPHEFSAELIANYQKMIESIEGKEGAIFSQRKFWEGQYMQSPAQQTNSAFGLTDVVKIQVEQSAYDKLKEVAIAGHDRIKWHTWCVEVLAIDCVPVFVNKELAGQGICRVYTNHKIINLEFYPENLTPKRPMTIKFTDI